MGIGALLTSCFPFKSTQENTGTIAANSCQFCDVSSERGFNVMYEDEQFIVFRDRSPAAQHHLLVTPKAHIANVKSLTKSDLPLVESMNTLGHKILEDLDVPLSSRRLGFHIPPFTSVDHLHLHVQGLPYRSFIKQSKYPVSSGSNGQSKGYGWFVEVEQLTRILEQGGQFLGTLVIIPEMGAISI